MIKRVHNVLFYIRLKTNWKVYISKYGHNYTFVKTNPRKIECIIICCCTSKRCFRITTWNKEKKEITYISRKTPHQTALKINEIMATTDKEPVSNKGEKET